MSVTILALYVRSAFERVYFLSVDFWMNYKLSFYAGSPEMIKKEPQKF